MRPLISYYGGKQRIASKIIPFIPKHTVYAEPFCGGATVLFRKPWPEVSNTSDYREYINDTSEQLINMYRVFQTRFDEIEHLIMNTLYSESEYKKAKAICRGDLDADDLWRAWAYYVNIRQSFAGVLNGGWGRVCFTVNMQSTWHSKQSSLNEYRDRMASVGIACTDALNFIKQYDYPQTFFYCDPPYPGTDQGHYKGYSQSDFDALIDLLKSCEGSAIVSCYDQPCPEGWIKKEIPTVTSASRTKTGDKSRTEVLLIKRASKPRDEIQKLYDSGKYDCFTGDKIWETA